MAQVAALEALLKDAKLARSSVASARRVGGNRNHGGRDLSHSHPYKALPAQQGYERSLRFIEHTLEHRWRGVAEVEFTKAGYFARLSPDDLRELEHAPVDRTDFIGQANKVEKDKLRPLISFFTATFLQMGLVGHAIEKGVTKTHVGIVMSSSPIELISYFQRAVINHRENPLIRDIIADLRKCDAQHLEQVLCLYARIRQFIGIVALQMPPYQRWYFLHSMELYIEHCLELTINFIIFGQPMKLRQFLGTVTGSILTKITNSMIVGDHLLVDRDCLVHIHSIMGINMGLSTRVSFSLDPDLMRMTDRAGDILNDRGVQGDDIMATAPNSIVHNVAIKLFEVINVEFKEVQSPGSRFGVFLQHQIDQYGWRRFPARDTQSTINREPHRKLLTLREHLQTNISTVRTMEMRGCSEATAWVLYGGICDFIFGNRELLHINQNCGGFGMLYPDGITNEPVSRVRYRDPSPVPHLPKSYLDSFESLQYCLKEDEDFYKASGLDYPAEVARTWYDQVASTLRVSGGPGISTALRKASIAAFISHVDMTQAPYYGVKGEAITYWPLYYILNVWDPALKAFNEEGIPPEFGNNNPFLSFGKIVFGSCFRDVRFFVDYCKHYYHQKLSGKYPRCCVTKTCDFRTPSYVVLALGQFHLQPAGYSILEQIVVATSHDNGHSSVLFGMAQADARSKDFNLDRDYKYKDQSYLSQVADAVGPHGVCIPGWVEENVQVMMNRFARDVAWDVCSKHWSGGIDRYTREMLSKDRGYAYISWLVRATLILLSEYRQQDICVQGVLSRGLQLGLKQQTRRIQEMIGSDDFYEGMSVVREVVRSEYENLAKGSRTGFARVVVKSLYIEEFEDLGPVPGNKNIVLPEFTRTSYVSATRITERI
jgi:hypothetical protein